MDRTGQDRDVLVIALRSLAHPFLTIKWTDYAPLQACKLS